MTHTEKESINRKIAEWLEPTQILSDALPVSKIRAGASSPLGCWKVKAIRHELLMPWEWRPRDFFTDEIANAMLLDRMPEPQLWLESAKDKPKLWGCTADMMSKELDAAFDSDRRTAVVLTFLAWMESKQATHV